jgi:hypothetical protein
MSASHNPVEERSRLRPWYLIVLKALNVEESKCLVQLVNLGEIKNLVYILFKLLEPFVDHNCMSTAFVSQEILGWYCK